MPDVISSNEESHFHKEGVYELRGGFLAYLPTSPVATRLYILLCRFPTYVVCVTMVR